MTVSPNPKAVSARTTASTPSLPNIKESFTIMAA
jgi:hypothetical protein